MNTNEELRKAGIVDSTNQEFRKAGKTRRFSARLVCDTARTYFLCSCFPDSLTFEASEKWESIKVQQDTNIDRVTIRNRGRQENHGIPSKAVCTMAASAFSF